MRALKMISSMASRDVLSALAARFENVHACQVVLEAAGGVDVAKRVRRGEAADVIVLARNTLEALAAEGIVRLTSITDLVLSGIAVAVPAHVALPDVASEAAVRRVVEQAPSLSYSTGPSGVYLEKLFASWGILEDVRARIVVPPPGMPVGALLSSGKVALGFQQLSELVNVAGVRVAGLLPPGIQLMTTFSGAVAANTVDEVRANELLTYLSSPQTAELKRQFGMEAC